nr:MAG TPA: hypothetical protein [Caudoviricetes sp.]DAX18875.1 MAG TPA: hypothetical protein [Caudoviricetes sp.]
MYIFDLHNCLFPFANYITFKRYIIAFPFQLISPLSIIYFYKIHSFGFGYI